MIDIGTYGLHVVHGAFNYGIESADWKIKGTLEGSHQLNLQNTHYFFMPQGG